MKTRIFRFCAVLLMASSPPLLALAQINKCTAADGTVTYTDEPCPRTHKRESVDARATVVDHGPIQREMRRPGNAAVEAEPRRDARSASRMSEAERELRTRNLRVDLDSHSVTTERRLAAIRELELLGRQVPPRSTEDDRRLRNAKVGLDSTDGRERARALQETHQVLDEIDRHAR